MTIKPRNHVVLAMLKSAKKGGAHVKPKKTQRQQDKIALKKGHFDVDKS